MRAAERPRPAEATRAVTICGVLFIAAATASVLAQDASSLALPGTPALGDQGPSVLAALVRLPIAAALASALALRPRRRGTPPRQPPVIQTQIILAVIGSLVMLVVGSSLARAFGIVGAAGLVRYRAKVEDPKDAGVMLSTLAVGLATGVGQWLLAAFGTVFILVLLWILESFEPKSTRLFSLKIKAKTPEAFKPKVEAFLRDHGATFEIRTVAPEELLYELRWPVERKTVRVSERIAAMDPSGGTEVELEQLKEKKG